MAEFDRVISDRYGIMVGSHNLVLIKTGKGGSIYGYNNKYCRIVNDLRTHYSCSFVVSANSVEEDCDLVAEIDELENILGSFEEIIFIGISNGALAGAQQAYKCSRIKNMLLINGPLMINWNRTKRGLEAFTGERIRMIYGSEDPSNKFIGLLEFVNSNILEYDIYHGMDHNFSNDNGCLWNEIEWMVGDAMYTSAKFIVNDNNRSAYESAVRWSELKRDKETDLDWGQCLLYIYGKSGSGKTHLLLHVMEEYCDSCDIYQGNDEFEADLTYSGLASYVMVDDIQRTLVDDNSSEQLIMLIEQCKKFKKPLLLTGNVTPEELPTDRTIKNMIKEGRVEEIRDYI